MNKSTTPETGARPSTDCQHEPFLFPDLFSRKVVLDFSGGTLSSDGGLPLVRQVDAGLGLTRTLAGCFSYQRNQLFVDHSMQQLPLTDEAGDVLCRYLREARPSSRHRELFLRLNAPVRPMVRRATSSDCCARCALDCVAERWPMASPLHVGLQHYQLVRFSDRPSCQNSS